jgi:hypothetical protein
MFFCQGFITGNPCSFQGGRAKLKRVYDGPARVYVRQKVVFYIFFYLLSHIIFSISLGIGICTKSAQRGRICSVFVRVFSVELPIEFLPLKTRRKSKKLKGKSKKETLCPGDEKQV